MATQAQSYEAIEAAAWGIAAPRREYQGESDRYQLPPIPAESIYLYRKVIDNSRVVRQADPLAAARCWRWIATATAGTFLLVALLWPNVYGMLAGYQVESLKAQQQRLLAERSTLELEEARLLSPDRLEELARTQQFIDPAPDQIVFLHPKADGSLALNARPK